MESTPAPARAPLDATRTAFARRRKTDRGDSAVAFDPEVRGSAAGFFGPGLSCAARRAARDARAAAVVGAALAFAFAFAFASPFVACAFALAFVDAPPWTDFFADDEEPRRVGALRARLEAWEGFRPRSRGMGERLMAGGDVRSSRSRLAAAIGSNLAVVAIVRRVPALARVTGRRARDNADRAIATACCRDDRCAASITHHIRRS